MFHNHTVVLLLLPQVWIVPVNVAVARNEEPVRVSDTHQIHISTDNRIRQLQRICRD